MILKIKLLKKNKRKIFALILFAISINLLSQDIDVLACENIGAVYQQDFINSELKGTEKEKAQKTFDQATVIINITKKIVDNYVNTNSEAKQKILENLNKGLANLLSPTQIGSGNLVIFSIFSRLRLCIVTDLSIDRSSSTHSKLKNDVEYNSITKEQLEEMVNKEFKVKISSADKSSLDYILEILEAQKGEKYKLGLISNYPPYNTILEAISQNMLKSVLRANMLSKIDIFSCLLNYLYAEIINTGTGLFLKGKNIDKTQRKNFKLKYNFYYEKLSPFQRDLLGFKPLGSQEKLFEYKAVSIAGGLEDNFVRSLTPASVKHELDAMKMIFSE